MQYSIVPGTNKRFYPSWTRGRTGNYFWTKDAQGEVRLVSFPSLEEAQQFINQQQKESK